MLHSIKQNDGGTWSVGLEYTINRSLSCSENSFRVIKSNLTYTEALELCNRLNGGNI